MRKYTVCAALALVLMLMGTSLADTPAIGGGLRNTPAPAETAAPAEAPGEVSGDALPVDPADCAEGTDALILNPRDRYPFFVEQTDGSEVLVFGLLDTVNDEAERAAAEGAVYQDCFGLTEEGALEGIYTLTAFPTDYGKALVLSEYGSALMSILIGGQMCNVVGNAAALQEPYMTAEDVEFAWDTMCFPFCELETMHAFCTDGDTTYYLMSDVDGNQIELVTDAGMLISEIRMYAPLGDGNFQLALLTRYGTCPAPELPQVLIDALTAE